MYRVHPSGPHRDPMTDAWRTMPLPDREREYSPSSMIGGDLTAVMEHYRGGSAAARRQYPPTTHRFGAAADELVDLYLPKAAPAGPLHIFIHGGYWQELSRLESSFMAVPLLERGSALAVVDYTLAPAATLETMVDQCRRAVAWCGSQAPRWGLDLERIILSGSSAGAHLAAMVLTQPSPVSAAVLLSGIFDLEPLIGTYLNEAVRIDQAVAVRLSPIRLAPARSLPIVVATGAIETAEFQRQSDQFAARWTSLGCSIARVTVEGRHHFDLPDDLGLPATPIGRAALDFER